MKSSHKKYGLWASLKTRLIKEKTDRCGSCKETFRRRAAALRGRLTQQMSCIAVFSQKGFLEMPLCILLLTPVILAITECLLWFSNLNYDAVIGGWVSENKFSYFAVMCFYFLPFIRIIIETTGFVPALKNKMKLYSVLFSIEILLDLRASLKTRLIKEKTDRYDSYKETSRRRAFALRGGVTK